MNDKKSPPEPTHTITHRRFGTTAHVPLHERVGGQLDRKQPLGPGDKKYVAMAFKNTPPVMDSGPDLSDDFVAYGALEVTRIQRGLEYGEDPNAMMDHHGDPIDPQAD